MQNFHDQVAAIYWKLKKILMISLSLFLSIYLFLSHTATAINQSIRDVHLWNYWHDFQVNRTE